MKKNKNIQGELIIGVREALKRGENMMLWAKSYENKTENSVFNALVAYDLQSGSYVEYVQENLDFNRQWGLQLSEFIKPFLSPGGSILEVGVGEATTLSSVIHALEIPNLNSFGFDISWSRISVADRWLNKNSKNANLFVADLFNIPLSDNSIDVVYTSHSLEPNGGKEAEALRELIRVAKKAVVLIEPIYELGNEESKKRMDQHGYVKNLKAISERFDVKVLDYRLLNIVDNPLNPSGVIVLKKEEENSASDITLKNEIFQCPITGSKLINVDGVFFSDEVGLAYPNLKGFPLLRREHAIIASKFLINN
jgi:ubiquinone/menaquinone biosynthesis C-methylase UbiE